MGVFSVSSVGIWARTTSGVMVTLTTGRGIIVKLNDGVRETGADLKNMSFKGGEACVEIVGGGEDGIGGSDKRVKVSEDTSLKVWLRLLPRRMRLLPRKWWLGYDGDSISGWTLMIRVLPRRG